MQGLIAALLTVLWSINVDNLALLQLLQIFRRELLLQALEVVMAEVNAGADEHHRTYTIPVLLR